MGQKLVIVESPAKAKTIGKYLGKTYTVTASMGHVRDLPKSKLGVDIENNYEPKYITIRGKGELLDKLRKEAKKSEKIYLATDPDREGEAISWHLANVLKIDNSDNCRIEFNEITKNAIKNAIKSPRPLDMDLIDAQQARRVLDRLVGYEISPILWRKIKWGLSAGRVQSVALKMICDKEEEIKKFVSEEYWTIECELVPKNKKTKAVNVQLTHHKNKKISIKDEMQCKGIMEELEQNDYVVDNIRKTKKKKNQPNPFITSTLQQEAYKKLNFSTKKTMSLAQQLYEGIDVKGHGTIGLITYMRTDSIRISKEAEKSAEDYIVSIYGKEYLRESKNNKVKANKNIQDAHEAIRPTYIELNPDEIKDSLKRDQYKLYKLIWQRFLASQMAICLLNTVSIDIKNGEYLLKASGSTIEFDGFTRVYNLIEESDTKKVPNLEVSEILEKNKIESKQHFTQPPARFSEATLVKNLEENGIGRPSTYAPIISTILDRKYVEREGKALTPTELGIIVNDIMSNFFKQIVDMEFTAEMEKKLDLIEEGKVEWKKVVDEFFTPLKVVIDKAEKEIAKITIEDKVTDVKCDKCGKYMVIKHGRFGDFLACPGYPECKNTKPILKELDVECPKCGGKVLIRKSKKGRTFYGCSNYPECDFVSWFEPTNKKCPNCGSYMTKRYNKSKGNYYQCSSDKCNYKELTNEV
ncbi:type I DNA topoisomerase [Haloimpatiens sp. FM7315]|uniref:type I DNA topoisomerase n=1 Tax=Haloimpatiens sp. FM7315 TaxID=3298609 RepID=UPI0035A2AA1F